MVSTLSFATAILAILPSIVNAWPINARQAITTAEQWINDNCPGKYQECTPQTMTVRRDW